MDKIRNMFEQFSKRDIEVLQIIALICVGLAMLFFRNSSREIKLGIFIITQFILPVLFSAERESKKHSSTFLLLLRVNNNRTFSDPLMDTLGDSRHRIDQLGEEFRSVALRALNTNICLAKMLDM